MNPALLAGFVLYLIPRFAVGILLGRNVSKLLSVFDGGKYLALYVRLVTDVKGIRCDLNLLCRNFGRGSGCSCGCGLGGRRSIRRATVIYDLAQRSEYPAGFA